MKFHLIILWYDAGSVWPADQRDTTLRQIPKRRLWENRYVTSQAFKKIYHRT